MRTRSRPARLAGVLLLTPLLTITAPTPSAATAAGPSPVAPPAATAAEDAPRASSRPDPAVALAGVEPAGGLETAKSTRPVAPGLSLTSFDRYDAAGWLRADALTADLGGGLTVDYVNSGEVTRDEPLRAAVDRSRAVAAVNGDFFDINNSGAAQGVGIRSGELVQSPIAGHPNAVGISAQGIGRVVEVGFEGAATLPAGPVPLTQFNNMVQRDGVGVFTPLWGSYTRKRAVEGAARTVEVTLTGGRVASVATTAGEGPIPAGSTVLLGREAGADALAALRPGDAVDVTWRPRASDGGDLRAAVGGGNVLVRDGVVQTIADASLAPRTAVGFSADGRKMIMMTVDGRQVDSRGVTQTEMGRMMAELGAANALNLDGGGSSTLLAREPGAATVQVENSPSDGSERPVPNGLAVYAPKGSGRLAGYWLETASDPTAAPGVAPVRGGRPDRVFPGLTRRLTAAGYDETYGPAAGEPRWHAIHGRVDGDGVFRAAVPGRSTVTAARGRARGTIELTVLGPLQRIDGTVDRVGLDRAGDSGLFGVVGYDAEGNTAPIEPADLKLEYDRDLLSVTPTADGNLSVKALAATGSALVTARVGNHSTVLPVTVGLTDVPVAGFDDAASWKFSQARASGSVAPAEGHTGGGLRMSYDFSQSTGTRAAYADPPAWIDVPGQPQAFGMWIKANGTGEWPSLHLHDAQDTQFVLRGPYLDWTGWKYVEFAVPPGVQYPVRVRRFYVAETDPAKQYRSEVVIDDLVARVPPDVQAPPEPNRTDRVVLRDGTVDGAPWRFAVLSDAQFVAANPDSDLVAQARRTLREVRAARPDFLIINGDFVDTAYPADFALAKRILDEELGGEVPYHYVPGNHEIMGAPIDNFRSVFGDTSRVFDHRGTRFLTLSTATGSLRGGGFDQVELLRRTLDQAAGDRSVGSVAVLFHHPPRDPSPAKASQLGDRKEAALVEQWLADFQHRTGKGALMVNGHVGTFHADRVDGVPYVINGNSGKDPSTPAALGGFTGWTEFGVDPVTPGEAERARRDPLAEGPTWVSAEMHAHVDRLALTAPAQVRQGSPVDVTATLTQPSGRQVPVAAPVSADWSGSPNLHIGGATGVRPWHVARFDPATGRLTALRPGAQVLLAVTVNGVKAETTVTTAAAVRAPAA
ncbi:MULTISPECIES: phosphodiester glycosidase family protein [unclassified Micromonospora]|uniref:phosphodiester glycosidase family protein n=1 Tax=unclassified Micromonospora TaxID=2617518 RepID=UPI001126B69C|nr:MULTISPECIES: phosphodiester glycosidase family protein [unclassified Micromonospora]MCK1809661.1 phosphodiester glycosidase family protein [Micromonospora sp. R42106]MCK1834660.1 phosphodiester glycosidase family protein [Micromonospora sp. R42003]MCK1846564.1 phosphodiester glycosidase family protein [Micromonospora sp. R42004]MCM1017550.1 phosphodiester glycosidase family protein [Micromonospora sp. XM-20-01]